MVERKNMIPLFVLHDDVTSHAGLLELSLKTKSSNWIHDEVRELIGKVMPPK